MLRNAILAALGLHAVRGAQLKVKRLPASEIGTWSEFYNMYKSLPTGRIREAYDNVFKMEEIKSRLTILNVSKSGPNPWHACQGDLFFPDWTDDNINKHSVGREFRRECIPVFQRVHSEVGVDSIMRAGAFKFVVDYNATDRGDGIGNDAIYAQFPSKGFTEDDLFPEGQPTQIVIGASEFYQVVDPPLAKQECGWVRIPNLNRSPDADPRIHPECGDAIPLLAIELSRSKVSLDFQKHFLLNMEKRHPTPVPSIHLRKLRNCRLQCVKRWDRQGLRQERKRWPASDIDTWRELVRVYDDLCLSDYIRSVYQEIFNIEKIKKLLNQLDQGMLEGNPWATCPGRFVFPRWNSANIAKHSAAPKEQIHRDRIPFIHGTPQAGTVDCVMNTCAFQFGPKDQNKVKHNGSRAIYAQWFSARYHTSASVAEKFRATLTKYARNGKTGFRHLVIGASQFYQLLEGHDKSWVRIPRFDRSQLECRNTFPLLAVEIEGDDKSFDDLFFNHLNLKRSYEPERIYDVPEAYLTSIQKDTVWDGHPGAETGADRESKPWYYVGWTLVLLCSSAAAAYALGFLS